MDRLSKAIAYCKKKRKERYKQECIINNLLYQVRERKKKLDEQQTKIDRILNAPEKKDKESEEK